MENTQQLLNDQKEKIQDRAGEFGDRLRETAEEVKETVTGGRRLSAEDQFLHDVGHKVDEAAECLDDMCTYDSYGVSGEFFWLTLL